MTRNAWRLIAIWLTLIVAFLAVYAAATEAGGAATMRAAIEMLVLVAGLFGVFGLVQLTPRGRRPVKRYAVACLVGVALVAGVLWPSTSWLAFGIAPFATLVLVVVALRAGMRATRRRVDAIRAALPHDDVTALLAPVRRWRWPDRLGVVLNALYDGGRPDLVLELLADPWWRHEPLYGQVLLNLHRVWALLELGRTADAAAALAETPFSDLPQLRDHIDLTTARIAIAEGRDPQVPELRTRMWTTLRSEIMADALAHRGDREGARRALLELRQRTGDGRIRKLADSNRPSAAIAIDVLANAAPMYR